MSKSLKDIVEDGFNRLAVLADKRKELMARCDELAEGTSSKQCQQGVNKLEQTELTYTAEVNSHVDRSKEVLQQTLSQIVEDNERYLASVKENLQLRISRVFKELAHTREWVMAGAAEKFDSSVRPLERETEAGVIELRFEAVKLLGELEAACSRNQSALHEVQAEIAGNLSSNEHELTASLGTEFSALVQESARRRTKQTETLEKLYSEQASQMTSLTEEMDLRISLVVTQNLETVKKLGKESEKAIDGIREEVISSAATEIVNLSQESFSELEASYEFSHHELSEKLTDLRSQTDSLLAQVKQQLADLETSVRASCQTVSEEVKKRPVPDPSATANLRNPVDEAIKQLSRELDVTSTDFKRQLNELLKIQSDRLNNLCASAESSISATALALNTELKQMSRLHEQTWGEREQELQNRLRKLEKEALDTYALVAGSADTNSNDSDGGS